VSLPIELGEGCRRLLCLGAHSDDIEIGCGGTILSLLAANPDLHVDYVVLTASPEREQEARQSAGILLAGAKSRQLVFQRFRNGFFPYEGAAIKEFFEELKKQVQPDLILTQSRDDRHQDHRVTAELTWNTFRDHLIVEYEIPKYDGELTSPNLYVPLSEAVAEQKISLLMTQFASQHSKPWFDERTFRALMRLRGLECNAPSGWAEAFAGRKLTLGIV